jgi:S-adenosylmethionine synthetase
MLTKPCSFLAAPNRAAVAVIERDALHLPRPRRCQRDCQVAAKAWLQRNLRFVDPERHFVFQSELKEGRPELTDLFVRETRDSGD